MPRNEKNTDEAVKQRRKASKNDNTKKKQTKKSVEPKAEREKAKRPASAKNNTPKQREKSRPAKKGSSKLRRKVSSKVLNNIPYSAIFQNGIIMTTAGTYTKSYRLHDAEDALMDDQAIDNIMLNYEGLLNSVGTDVTAQITVFNRAVDPDIVKNQVLLFPRNDRFNTMREEFNEVLIRELGTGKNNLSREKFLTIGITAKNIEEADAKFKEMDDTINSIVARINGEGASPLSIEERLSVLYDVYNNSIENSFFDKIAPIMRNDTLSLDNLNASRLTSKDLIAPETAEFAPDKFTLGDLHCRSFMVDILPNGDNRSLLSDIASMPCNMLTSVNYQSVPLDKILGQKANTPAQKKASRWSYLQNELLSEKARAKAATEKLRKEMMNQNQKLFRVSFLVTLFADTEKELETLTSSLTAIGIAHDVSIRTLMYQQKEGFCAALPLATSKVKVGRVLTTENSAQFAPFVIQDTGHNTGKYYGLNAITRNMILYDRTSSDNYNGIMMGKTEHGLKKIAVTEMVSTLLDGDDNVYILDMNGEYGALAERFGGQVFKFDGTTHYNPMDMDVQYSTENPVVFKAQFLTAFCELVMGEEIDEETKAIIDKCCRQVYQPYYKHMENVVKTRDEDGYRITCDRASTPLLVQFYRALSLQQDPKAQELASALEIYCIGTDDTMAKHTDFKPLSRLVIYDISDMPERKRTLAAFVALNDIWNRLIENKKHGTRTWLYLTSFAKFVQEPHVASFMEDVLTNAKQWEGIVTGLADDVEEFLIAEHCPEIIEKCPFTMILTQERIERAALADMYSINESLQDYIEDAAPGSGLFYNGIIMVPFVNNLSSDSTLFADLF